MRRFIKSAIWLMIACLAVFGAAITSGERPKPAIYLDWAEPCVSYAQAVKALEGREEPASAAVWTVDGDLAEYRGDWRLLTGDSLKYGQCGGLMVSRDLALEKFGSDNAAGREIEINGRSLVIRGVYETGVARAILEDADDYKARSYMALSFPETDKSQWSAQADAARASMGLGKPLGERDAALLYSICDLSFLRSLVPTRWADFDGWRDNTDALIKRLAAFVCEKLDPVQAACLWGCVKTVVYYALALYCAHRAAALIIRRS